MYNVTHHTCIDIRQVTLSVDSIDTAVGELPPRHRAAPSENLRPAVMDSCYQVFVDVLLYLYYIRSPSLPCLLNDSVIDFQIFHFNKYKFI